jgi:iron complex outermembrane receptor protein
MRSLLVLSALFLTALPSARLGGQPVPPAVKATVEVVGVTPVDGVGVDSDQYPADVQVLIPRDERGSAADAALRQGASVQVSEAQGNRFQPDLLFRGAVASALLGTPQGVAVFQDGVRLNEPFGDTVNWDAVPDSAIGSVQMIPGANAAFGLNALAGVIAFRTKSGFSDSGFSVRAGSGSFGSVSGEIEQGGHHGNLAYFVTASHDQERGWRDFAPSRLDRLFGKLQQARAKGSSDLRLTLADTVVTGNGASPVQLVSFSRKAVFTHPDETRNRTLMLASSHDAASPAGLVEGNLFVRRTLTRTGNGDASPYQPCLADPSLLCDDTDQVVVDRGGEPARISSGHPLDAVMNHTFTAQTLLGAAAQLSRASRLFGAEHRLTVGLSLDRGVAGFSSQSELADLTPSRAAAGTGRIAAESIVGVNATTSTASIFVTDLVPLTAQLTSMVAVRANRSEIRLVDRVGDELSGRHQFRGVNPSVGVTYAARVATLFANVSQSSRNPTPVELTCANPDDPCRLPNAFVSDPPLRQVVGRGAELGIRGRMPSLRWSVAAFRTLNHDDIIFISSGRQQGHGYFDNVGDTKRQGLEATVDGRLSAGLGWFANGSLLDATFHDSFTVSAPNHPHAIDGELQVRRGDRLPLIPRRTLKGGLTWGAPDSLRLSAVVRHVSSAYFRGDEANTARPLASYTVADLSASVPLGRRLSFELSVRNVANAAYATFGTFGDATAILGDAYSDRRFISPAEPRRLQLMLAFVR